MEKWNKGMIVSIRKKGEGDRVQDYRRVTLMPSFYKVYGMILGERLEKEVEEGGRISQNQTGFRKRMGIMNNVYVLNYLVSTELNKRKGKIVAFSVDLREAFDFVDKGSCVRL